MTVPATARRAGPYIGNGSATIFSFSFKTFAAGDLQVTRTDTATGIDTVLVLNSDYSVALNPDQDVSPGGTITYPISGSALPSTQKLTIVGDLDYEQTTDLLGGGAFNARVIEDTFDRTVIQIQQLEERMDRALMLPVSSSGVSPNLPSPEPEKVIGWNAAGTALRNLDANTLATIVAYGTANSDIFSGNGTQTVFTLSASPGTQNNLDVSISGVTQYPGLDYTWSSGTNITFTSAPPAGTNNVLVRYMQALAVGTTVANLVAATDNSGGGLFSTVQGFIDDVQASSGAGVVGYSSTATYANGTVGNAINQVKNNVDADGVFFDTAAGDTFTGQTQYPTNAALTVTPSKAAFNAAVATVSDIKVEQPDGNLLKFCFDNWTIEATYTVTSFPAADAVGFLTGFLDYNPLPFGGEVKAHPGSATQFFARLFLNNAIVANDTSGFSFTAGDKVVVQVVYAADTLTYKFTFGAGSQRSLTTTMVLTATSYELPRLFVNPVVRMTTGVFELNSLKVYAKYPKAKFAFVGDSLTQGRFVTTFADGFPQLMRTQFPNGVLVCGAPSAKVGDWLVPIYSVTAMAPRYAFILLGTNDVTTGVPLATFQTNYTSLLNKLVAAGITPIIMTIPPNGNSNTPSFNTWLKGLGYQYIDIYTTLYGSGNSMNATYDSGDGIHPNTAGNLAIYNAIMTFIQTNGI